MYIPLKSSHQIDSSKIEAEEILDVCMTRLKADFIDAFLITFILLHL